MSAGVETGLWLWKEAEAGAGVAGASGGPLSLGSGSPQKAWKCDYTEAFLWGEDPAVFPPAGPVKAGVFVLFTSVSQIPIPLLGEPLARRHLRDEWFALWALRLGVIGWGEQLHLTSALFQVDNAYWLWTFQGRLLQKNNKDRFCQLLWRPRPPTLLSQDQIKV